MASIPQKYTCWTKHYRSLESTNKEAHTLLSSKDIAIPAVIIADEQTKGRGREGRQWVSPKGNLYISLIVSPCVKDAYLPQLSFVAALALRKTIAPLLKEGISCEYKWPNDMLVEGKKIAGILLERGKDLADNKPVVIVGIGLNVLHHPQLEEVRAITHLYAHLAKKRGGAEKLNALSTSLCEHFFAYMKQWEDEGFVRIQEEWMSHATGIGTSIKVRLANQEHSGIFKGLSPKGACILTLPNGQEVHMTAGDVFFTDTPQGE